ncbi:uncharacterized protein EV422DRAFT_512756 [Fimicolochytrium jonesii]|uniref:uncharacterized protein n=1 Tax=Fimicolochytrium jonesii TaxID=1396493 RepID=UPI0022FE73C4|nr:uncharacterized protein EV422DRAFT_512756 [Fimicolochytrium jonesii]KAI8827126.1 hypothetical protein EV422DRAFT_512756 [Fimicolochytrium jonesii]
MGPPTRRPPSTSSNALNPRNAIAIKKKLAFQQGRHNPGLEKKSEMIRRTRIKREYYKMLEKEGMAGGKMEVEAGEEEEEEEETFAKPVKGRAGKSKPAAPASSDSEEDVASGAPSTKPAPSLNPFRNAPLPSRGQKGSTTTKPRKADPFAKAVREAQKKKAERQAAIEEAQRLKKEKEEGRDAYYKKRNNVRDKLQMKTRKGQPVMANQISHLLDKIQGKI